MLLRSNKTIKNFRYRTFSKFLKITTFCFSFCVSAILELVFCALLQMDLFQRKMSVYLETIVLRGSSFSWKIFNNRLISMLTGFQRKRTLTKFLDLFSSPIHFLFWSFNIIAQISSFLLLKKKNASENDYTMGKWIIKFFDEKRNESITGY